MSDNLFTNIEVKPMANNHPTIKANGKLLVAGTVEVKFTVMSGAKGLFVSLPSRSFQDKDGNTKYSHLVHFPNADVYKTLQQVVLSEYKKVSGSPTGEDSQVVDDLPF